MEGCVPPAGPLSSLQRWRGHTRLDRGSWTWGGAGRAWSVFPCLGTAPLSCRKPSQAAATFGPAARADCPSFHPSVSGLGPYPSLMLGGTVSPQKGLSGSPHLPFVNHSPAQGCLLLSSPSAHPERWVFGPTAPSTWNVPSLPLQNHTLQGPMSALLLLLQAVLPAQGPHLLTPARLLVRAAA